MRISGQGSQVWLIAIGMLWAVQISGQEFTISTVAGGVPPPTPVVATRASIRPEGVAVDAAGNVYFSTSSLCVFKLDSAGILTLVAGNSRPGYSGDGGPATSAQLNGSTGIALDGGGNVYIADGPNNRIRRVSTSGIITTIAGTGEQGFSGDGGAAISARLSGPSGVAVDGAGNLYIADTSNHRIRRVSPAGVIATVAGTSDGGYSGDGGPATSARLLRPGGVAVDGAGNLYIADTGNNCVRRVSPSGVISTVASDMAGLRAVAVDNAGNLFIADTNHHRVYRSPNLTLVAGTGDAGFSGDGGPATSAQFNGVSGVAADAAGNIYIADTWNRRLRRVSPSGIVSTVAGDGTDEFSGDGGPASAAQIGYPYGVAVDSAGNLYISDYSNHRVRRASLSGTITTVAGTGISGYSGDGGPATSAQLKSPFGVAVDQAGNLYIGDSDAACIRRVSASGVISTVAGTGVEGFSGDGGPAISAQLGSAIRVALDRAGNLYISDGGNHRIRRVSPSGIITTVAGIGAQGYSGDGGQATSAQLSSPRGIAVDELGNVYFADSGNNRVRRISPAGVISTVAGNGAGGFSGDGGPAASAQLGYPYAVAVDGTGNLFVAQYFDHRVRRVSTSGIISTVAGDGTGQYSGDGGPAGSASLAVPTGLAVDAAGRIYVTTWTAVRVLTPTCPVSISSADLGVAASGGTVTLSIHADPGCAWLVSGLPPWLALSGSTQGTGPATVSLTAAYNPGGARSASISIGGVSVPVRQFDSSVCGGSSSCVAWALPHVAAGGEWTTSLFAVSSSTAAATFSVSFYGDNGSSIALPFTGGGNLSALTDSVPAQGRKDYEAGSASSPLQGGWGLLVAEKSITSQAAFRRATVGGIFYEAAVPASEGYSGFVIPFDASTFPPTGGPMYTGFAIANLNPIAAAHVTCTARDQWGTVIPNAVTIPTLNPSGHHANYLFPALTGKRGTLDCTADTLVSAIALRFVGTDAFSTLPVIVK